MEKKTKIIIFFAILYIISIILLLAIIYITSGDPPMAFAGTFEQNCINASDISNNTRCINFLYHGKVENVSSCQILESTKDNCYYGAAAQLNDITICKNLPRKGDINSFNCILHASFIISFPIISFILMLYSALFTIFLVFLILYLIIKKLKSNKEIK